MADAPEAPAEQVQLPAPSLREQAVTLARTEMDARPEATAEGTAPASEPETPPEVTPPEPESPPEDVPITREEHERALARQKASFQQGMAQVKALEDRVTLLTELDQLRESDPDAWSERVERDPNAAAALADRATMIAPEVISRAKTEVVMDQARMLLSARPDIEKLIEEQPDEWNKANNPETGGIFGYIHRTALEQGAVKGVEDYKKSPDFKRLIEDAERRGAHNALGGIDSPPPSEEGQVVSMPERKFDNPRQQAVAMANKTFGRQIVDPNGIGRRRSA